jgi:hypothetical protein
MSWYWSAELGRNVLNPAKIVNEKPPPPKKKNKKKTHKKASNTEKKRGHVRKSPKDKKGEPLRKTRIKMLNKLIQKKYYKKKAPHYITPLYFIYI